jgi:hypothetical protein
MRICGVGMPDPHAKSSEFNGMQWVMNFFQYSQPMNDDLIIWGIEAIIRAERF